MAALRGYILEEILAEQLQGGGYSLLVRASQDPVALCDAGNGLRVRGRGADHQVDVLGELSWPIPYTFPVRLFVEAKFRSARVGLDSVRNALGVINDVNEHYSTASVRRLGAQPYRRFDYRYALFSTSGFTADAQQFALAQQISLISLEGPAFSVVRGAATRAADQIMNLARRSRLSHISVRQVREALRRALGTWPEDGLRDAREPDDDLEQARARASRVDTRTASGGAVLPSRQLASIAAELVELDGELYFATSASPFLIVVQPDDPEEIQARRGPQEVTAAQLVFAGVDTRDGDWALVASSGEIFRFGVPPLLEPAILTEVAAGRRARRRERGRAVTLHVADADISLFFEPPRNDIVADESGIVELRSDRLRAQRLDPAFIYRNEQERDDRGRSRWSRRAAAELVRNLRREGFPQAEVIVTAAQNGGYISRGDVYRIAQFDPEQRSLRGFTRPVRRIATGLKSRQMLSYDAVPALVAMYDSGVLATRFRVPDEFVEMTDLWDQEDDDHA